MLPRQHAVEAILASTIDDSHDEEHGPPDDAQDTPVIDDHASLPTAATGAGAVPDRAIDKPQGRHRVRSSLSPDALRAARRRLVQMHFDAGVGHLGGNLSCIDAMLLVFHEMLEAEDRFILSKGHSAGALYVALWSIDRLTDDQLKRFHKDDTLLAGHPPASGIAEIPFATGSLGHGLSLAAGTALGMRFKGNGAQVICLTSDGEWQEGSTWEALIFAAHRRLTNLTVLVDHNELQGFGSTAEVASMAPLWDRLVGFDVEVTVVDGHDIDAIRNALAGSANRLRIIVLKTIKGHGISFMENRMDSHYLPLTKNQYEQALIEMERV